jgi:hypothetical protein
MVMNRVDGVERDLSSAPSKVIWTVEKSSVDGSKLPWKRSSDAQNGLAWTGKDGLLGDYRYEWTADEVLVTLSPNNNATAYLTDVVGSRSVTVRAVVDGVTVEKTFSFGDGPLSVFGDVSGSWLKWSPGVKSGTSGDDVFQDSGQTFPAAAFCGGTVNNNVEAPGSSPESTGFTPSGGGWETPRIPIGMGTSSSEYARYASDSWLPRTQDYLSVSAWYKDYSPKVLRKGAFLAAGWAKSWYWSGEVRYDDLFNARVVYLDHGGVYRGNIGLGTFVACRRP